ncbi:hypothetical protein [Roseomonas sp. HF4]|uniref:hypothetical protein n=1 Tax=Roseomonas sp. HF4 TaxID=2562313 RepID=UPI0010C07620|nr:hypothetical protein [Roseomonas sp. HF4]
MARRRDFLLGLIAACDGSTAAAAAARNPAPSLPGGPLQGAQYYPRRRRVCWNERVRRFVGYDRYGRAMYRTYTRRVCRWRYY